MAIFNNMSITNAGKILYAKAQAGIELHFTKMMVGSGDIGTQNPETLIALVDPKYDVGIQSISPNTELKTATISGMINNSNITVATYVSEIGLFAQDPDKGEILYAYGSAGKYGDYMAPATSGAYSWNYQINAAIGNAANVTVELSNLVYDYGVINTNTTLLYISGGNQKEINKSIDNMFKANNSYAITTGSANTYVITLSPAPTSYKDGMPLSIKIHADSTGPSTLNVNGLGATLIKKANGNNVTNLKSNGIYTLRYNITTGNFILQGEGASGNALASDLLFGKTASTDADDIVGTIPSKGTQIFTPTTTDQTIDAGQYLSGPQVVAGDTDLVSPNIVAGINLFGVLGEATIKSLGGYRYKTGIFINGADISPVPTIDINLGFRPAFVLVLGTDGVHSGEINSPLVGMNTKFITQDSDISNYSSSISEIILTDTGFTHRLAIGNTITWDLTYHAFG